MILEREYRLHQQRAAECFIMHESDKDEDIYNLESQIHIQRFGSFANTVESPQQVMSTKPENSIGKKQSLQE